MDTIARAEQTRISLRPAHLLVAALCIIVVACGGGDDSDDPPPPSGAVWQAGVFQPASEFADQCESPRAGTDPSTGTSFPDQQGTGLDERNFLRSWSNNLYLWYNEITDRDPAGYQTAEYFDLLKTEETTPSGNPKDNFHFTLPTDEWQSQSQSGVSVGYGAAWSVINSTPPRKIVVAYVEPGSPAANANLARGAEILEIDGVDLRNGNDVDTLNAGLGPSQAGESHTFTVKDPNGTERTFSMTAQNVTSTPVLAVRADLDGAEVGYILFNDHIATAEQQLIDAINQLQGVEDLVLDVRYNGGGFLAIASQLSYMIAGPGPTSGQTFEALAFNDKHPDTNPVTGQPLSPTPFVNETVGLSSLPEGQALPSLNLDRVFIITGPGTCSASEAIINGLRGVNVEVIQIGETTCGKPYGFYPEDNCGTTYFSVQFKGENAQGFGEYPDGFSPQNQLSDAGVRIPGCSVGDDFANELGDPSEARLAAALHYRNNPDSPCGSPSGFGQTKFSASHAPSGVDGVVLKSPGLQNRIMRR